MDRVKEYMHERVADRRVRGGIEGGSVWIG